MRTRLLLLLPLLLLALGLSARAEDEWRLLEMPGRFQVEMPGEPGHTPPYGDPPTEAWQSDSGEPLHGFELLVTEHPGGTVQSAGEDGMLIATMSGRAKALGTRPTRTRRIQSARLPGCMFRVETEDADWDFMIRLHGDKVYTLSVSSMKGEGDDGAAKRFFDSFQVP